MSKIGMSCLCATEQCSQNLDGMGRVQGKRAIRHETGVLFIWSTAYDEIADTQK